MILQRNIYCSIGLLVLLLTMSASCYAQIEVDTAFDIQEKQRTTEARRKTVADLLAAEREGRDSLLQNSLLLSTKDARLDSFELESWKSYYSYINTGYKHRTKVFAWQLVSSYVIFFIVIFLVLCGMYFAWLQFKLALRQMEKTTDQCRCCFGF